MSDTTLTTAIQRRLDDLTKPPGSLGRLEEFVMRYCLCKGSAAAGIGTMGLAVFAGDHGITAEGVAPFPKDVTRQMVLNMLAGGAAVTVMCRNAGIGYLVVDAGVDADFDDHPLLLKAKAGRGTRSFLADSAMTPDELEKAFDAGLRAGAALPADLAGIGEMGIGNTSSASALFSLLLDLPARETVGAGTGASGSLLEHKRDVVGRAVGFHRKEWDGSAREALQRVGGFEIAAMTGFILESSSRKVPVVVDGFIATAAALCALKIRPDVMESLFFGHVSDESFHRELLRLMGARPILDLGMRLGEGSGAVLAMQVIGQAMNCYHQMATFSSAGVSNRDA